jgi:hypothetical protein
VSTHLRLGEGPGRRGLGLEAVETVEADAGFGHHLDYFRFVGVAEVAAVAQGLCVLALLLVLTHWQGHTGSRLHAVAREHELFL